MQPFHDYDLSKVIQNQTSKLCERVEKYSNDEIMANDLNLLADNCYEQFFIEPIDIREEEFDKRSIVQGKIKRLVDPFWRDVRGQEYVLVDGLSLTFYFAYSGDSNLFKCQASTFSLSGYPEMELLNDYLVLNYEVPLNQMQSDADKEKLMKQVERDVSSIKQGASYVNSDVSAFNHSLRQSALNMLQSRKKKVEQFYSVSKLFEVPVKKNDYASTHIPVQRKIQPISKKYNDFPNYYISDKEYSDVLLTIKHNGSTYERTPTSFKSLHEEDLRNMLLAALNGTYQGSATGETFRKNGKTDICIECENRAAFVAECKIWKGQSKIDEALKQLDGYLTWRDCKTALIFFVRNKEFMSVLDVAKQTLTAHPSIRQVKEIDRNEFECSYISNSNVGQLIKIQVILFNLYAG